jgi:hypothetical protein
MKNTFLCEIASYVGVPVEDLEEDIVMEADAFHCPSLVPVVGQHFFHFAVDNDPQWLHDVVLHFLSKRHPIFKTFKQIAKSLTEDQKRFLVLFLQTPIGVFCVYRARGYDGEGASFLHKDDTGFGYVIEPFDHWIAERTRLWRSQWLP